MAENSKRPTVRCDDCEGTGAQHPDCWLCEGELYVPAAKARAEGYGQADLTFADENDVHCPSCDGDSCACCEGMGSVDAELPAQQEDRALICAMTRDNRIPPLFYFDHLGRVGRDDDALLSPSAASRLSARGQFYHLQVLAFGDEISLQGDGHTEAKAAWRRHRERWKRWIADERERRAVRVGKKAAGRLLDGVTHDGMPEVLS